MRDLYEIGTMEFKDLKKYIELPSFQRSVVWSIEKKEEFIDTVLKGFPFGSLLLYKSSPSSYLLVDGLQRFTTLDDFSKNPFKYIRNYEDEFKEYFSILLKYMKAKRKLKMSTVDVSIASNVPEITVARFENLQSVPQAITLMKILASVNLGIQLENLTNLTDS